MPEKYIRSEDGELSVPYSEVRHACMTGSIHGLLQYLLLFDYETVAHHTCFFLGYGVKPQVAKHLPAVYYSTKQTGTVMTPSRWVDKIRIRLTKNVKYPFLRKAKIFAIDLGFVTPLIGHRDYSLLSDGPLGLSQNMNLTSAEYQRQIRKHKTIQGRLEELLYGPTAVFAWGNNDQCREFYLTERNDSAVIGDKPVHIKSLQEMWDNASDQQRAFVKKVFEITNEDIKLLSSRKYMFLTQPMLRDRILTESEYLGILEQVFSHYDRGQLLLKLHPRDNFNYRRYFPDVAIYDKNVNMQLLVLLGTHVERAITICSSSVNSFPENVEVDWFGVEIHPKLKSFFGEMVPPYRKYNQM